MRRTLKATPTLAVVGLLVTGCSLFSEGKGKRKKGEAPTGAVLYGIGVSSDPYGDSAPSGFGVVAELGEPRSRKVEVRGRRWCPEQAAWLGPGRLLIPERAVKGASCTRQIIFRYRSGRLERAGRIQFAVPAKTWEFALSPNRRLVAAEPSVPCCGGGRRPSGIIFVARADGSRRHEVVRGHLAGWTPDGRVLYSTGPLFEFRAGDFLALDLASGKADIVLSHRQVAERARVRKAEIASPVWSPDRRYFAARALVTRAGAGAQRSSWAVVVAAAHGRIIQLLRSPYEISMFAWSPTGDRLAYTTSGFPAPHELFVVDGPDAKPRRIFMTDRHFDWITWSPTGSRLLLDDEHGGKWRLLDASRGVIDRVLPRLGGRPLWCCPQDEFSSR